MAPQPVILVGAGVIGLTTAYTILSRYPRIRLLVLASELPSDDPSSWTADYASMWAGAHYRPIAASTPQEHQEREFAIRTAAIMRSIAKKSPQAGVAMDPRPAPLANRGPAVLGELGLRRRRFTTPTVLSKGSDPGHPQNSK